MDQGLRECWTKIMHLIRAIYEQKMSGELKEKSKRGVSRSPTSEFDDALDGMKERWDGAFGEGQKLSTLMRDTNAWIYGEFVRGTSEFMRVSQEDVLKAENQKCLQETKETIYITLARFKTYRAVVEEAFEIVHSCKLEVNLLEQMDKLTKRLHELRASN